MLLVFFACYANSDEKISNLTTIKYSLKPFRTFEIVGTKIKRVKLEKLTAVLKKYKANNPKKKYQLIAEVKSVPETVKRIKKAIKDAGIKLNHYWVPTSFNVDIPGAPSEGYIDILKLK